MRAVREPGTTGYPTFRQLPLRWWYGQWAQAGCRLYSGITSRLSVRKVCRGNVQVHSDRAVLLLAELYFLAVQKILGADQLIDGTAIESARRRNLVEGTANLRSRIANVLGSAVRIL